MTSGVYFDEPSVSFGKSLGLVEKSHINPLFNQAKKPISPMKTPRSEERRGYHVDFGEK